MFRPFAKRGMEFQAYAYPPQKHLWHPPKYLRTSQIEILVEQQQQQQNINNAGNIEFIYSCSTSNRATFHIEIYIYTWFGSANNGYSGMPLRFVCACMEADEEMSPDILYTAQYQMNESMFCQGQMSMHVFVGACASLWLFVVYTDTMNLDILCMLMSCEYNLLLCLAETRKLYFAAACSLYKHTIQVRGVCLCVGE